MSLLEETRNKIAEEDRINLVKRLEDKIEEGRSAERLTVNQDWKRLSDKIKAQVDFRKRSVIEVYNSIVQDALDKDQILYAFIKIKEINSEINNFESFISMPEKTVQAGLEARRMLKNIGGQ